MWLIDALKKVFKLDKKVQQPEPRTTSRTDTPSLKITRGGSDPKSLLTSAEKTLSTAYHSIHKPDEYDLELPYFMLEAGLTLSEIVKKSPDKFSDEYSKRCKVAAFAIFELARILAENTGTYKKIKENKSGMETNKGRLDSELRKLKDRILKETGTNAPERSVVTQKLGELESKIRSQHTASDPVSEMLALSKTLTEQNQQSITQKINGISTGITLFAYNLAEKEERTARQLVAYLLIRHIEEMLLYGQLRERIAAAQPQPQKETPKVASAPGILENKAVKRDNPALTAALTQLRNAYSQTAHYDKTIPYYLLRIGEVLEEEITTNLTEWGAAYECLCETAAVAITEMAKKMQEKDKIDFYFALQGKFKNEEIKEIDHKVNVAHNHQRLMADIGKFGSAIRGNELLELYKKLMDRLAAFDSEIGAQKMQKGLTVLPLADMTHICSSILYGNFENSGRTETHIIAGRGIIFRPEPQPALQAFARFVVVSVLLDYTESMLNFEPIQKRLAVGEV